MNSSCVFNKSDALIVPLELVIYIPVFVLGLILNAAALVVFCVVLKKWTESSIYMTNLALMDLLLLLQLPFKMHARNNHWAADKRAFCAFLESLYFMSMYGSIYTIVCISIDRYISICHPFQARRFRSKKIARLICLAIWVFVVVATLPVYNFHDNTTDQEFRCFHGFSSKGWRTELIVCLEVFGFLLPTLVLVACSAQSIRVLRDSPSTTRAERQTGIRIIYSSMCVFLVPFTPCHIAIFFQYLVRSGSITDCAKQVSIALFVQLAMSLANVTCCLDAMCYYFIAKEVRDSRTAIRRSISRIRSTSTSEV